MYVAGREICGKIKEGNLHVPDPFTPSEVLNAVLATALFRCWHLILFFTAWSSMITVLNERGFVVHTDSVLLTVIGTVLGFVISYRTTSSFDRYNEGRRLWSDIILATRNFARNVWFHIPDPKPTQGKTLEQVQAKMLVEKKTVINLLGAYAIAVKHYLRGEDGIYYDDLYHSVKFLPVYVLPAARPDRELLWIVSRGGILRLIRVARHRHTEHGAYSYRQGTDQPYQGPSTRMTNCPNFRSNPIRLASLQGRSLVLPRKDETDVLLPASHPPKYHFFDLFPFSLLIPMRLRAEQNKSVQGRKAARLRAKWQSMEVSHNLPLELTLYLSSYIAALQRRDVCDHPTIANLTAALNMLVESLTGLERILTSPIPFSYAAHLWSVTTIYCLLLPSMVWTTLHWLTIPATSIVTFMFYGFLVAGEEIENPFGYDKNDLNLDHFTNNIIKDELRAVTSTPPPDVSVWAFVQENDSIFADHGGSERITPAEWLKRGTPDILRALGNHNPSQISDSPLDTPPPSFGIGVELCASPVSQEKDS